MPPKDQFRFRVVDNIGNADADEDALFLENCFVDSGELEALRDCEDPRRIIMGRTGLGKTALLRRLQQVEEHVIDIPPESLALAYVSNSSILQFIAQLGVKLDIFYRLLWRHVFTVELLKAHFKIENERAARGFWDALKSIFLDRRDQRALEYLKQWGHSFWQETDYRITEVTKTLESNVSAALKGRLGDAGLDLSTGRKLTEAEKGQVVQRAQAVVNEVQIKELSDILELLQKVLKDPKRPYYIVIDRLDENWVEDRQKYLLIRALIETVRDFRKVRNVKLIIALRLDLIERVFALTRDPGFQVEKYKGLYLTLRWDKRRLTEALDSRITFLVQQRYTKQPVRHADIMPDRVSHQTALTYILDRTMMRPRDVIHFFNDCIKYAAGKPKITSETIKRAEKDYSRERLTALMDEWRNDYPTLTTFTEILRKRASSFRLGGISDEECADFCYRAFQDVWDQKDELAISAAGVVDSHLAPSAFLKILVLVFYRVGLVGLKLPREPELWSINDDRAVAASELSAETVVTIHPFASQVLGVRSV